MSEITRLYQFRIYDNTDTAVETTFDSTDIVGLPRFGWTTPRPLDGKVENIPSVIRVADISEQVTAILADAGGRADLIGRLADIRINESGGGYSVVHQGRISAIRMSSGVSAYDFHVSDERWREDADVLTSGSTTQILPSGTISAFKDFPAAPTMTLQVVIVEDANTLVLTPVEPVLVTPAVFEWFENDFTFVLPFLSNASAFKYTKLKAGGSDRDILSFTEFNFQGVWGNLNEIAESGEPRELQFIRITWTTHGKSVGDQVSGCYLYAPSAPPTEWTPIHVGGAAGQDLFDWIKDQYDTLGIKYENPGAFSTYNASTNPNGLLAHPRIPPGHIRAVKPEKLRDMVEVICKMFGIVPFINSAGEVAPRFITFIQNVTPASLTELTGASLTEPHPSWNQTSEEIVTVIQPSFTYMSYVRDALARYGDDVPVDRIKARKYELFEWEHDRVSQLGRHVLKLDMRFITDPLDALALYTQQIREIFDRFGDGPITGAFRALSAASGVEPGDWVRLTLSSYPNMDTQARGGTRIVQILSREVESGYTFTYLDGGPSSAALTAPGVAIIKNATDGHHAVDVTISSLTAGSSYELQLKIGSEDWRTVAEGDANETVTIGNLPSGTNIQARALETAPGRIKSAYSGAVNVTLDALTAPNSLVVGSLAGDRGTGTWTNGETAYDIEVLLDGTRVAIVPARTTRFTLTGLTPSTTYNSPGMGVRHVDRYGGVSSTDTDDFSTTGTATTLTQPFATRILVGGDTV